MLKLTNPLRLKNIAKGTLAIVLTGSFVFGGTSVFADTTQPSPETPTTVGVTTGNTNGTVSDTTAPTNTTSGTSPTTSSTTTKTQETPSLVPGDFFYFAKIWFEKIQLALTSNETDQAKLLASNAAERLAEAQKLFQSGDQQKAYDTFQTSLDDMNSAEKIVDNKKAKDENNEEKNQSNSTPGTTTNSLTNATTSTSTAQVSPDLKLVETQLTQNILALEAALDKGHKSDKAKKALKKNIEKFLKALEQKGVAVPTTATTQDSNTTNTSGTTTDSSNTQPATTDGTTANTESNTSSVAPETPATTSQPASTQPVGTTVAQPAPTQAPATATQPVQAQAPQNHGQEVSQVAKQKDKENESKHFHKQNDNQDNQGNDDEQHGHDGQDD
jgi:hypothetical protein